MQFILPRYSQAILLVNCNPFWRILKVICLSLRTITINPFPLRSYLSLVRLSNAHESHLVDNTGPTPHPLLSLLLVLAGSHWSAAILQLYHIKRAFIQITISSRDKIKTIMVNLVSLIRTWSSSLLLVVGRQLKRFRNAVHFAVIAVELVELDGLWLISVKVVENCYYFLMSKGTVQPFHDLLELFNSELSALVSIIGGKCLIKG